MIKLSERMHSSRIDRPDEWSMDDYSREAKKLEDRIAELEEIVKAVAYIGVDFGYGKYELEAGKIDDARTLMEQDND